MDYTNAPSPYAAPNTPIASAKRAKCVKKDLKSPSVNKANVNLSKKLGNNSSKNESPNSTKDHAKSISTVRVSSSSISSSSKDAVPATPSKIMFSPMLRETASGDTFGDLSLDSECKEMTEEEEEYALYRLQENEVITNNGNDEIEDIQEEEEEDDSDVFNPYLFIAGLPHHSLVTIRGKCCLPALPTAVMSFGSNLPITLVLDLDETLVHCTVEPIQNPDLVFPVQFNGAMYSVYVKKRPYLDYFLETVAKSFEVVIFTASQKVYADVLLDRLDPAQQVLDSKKRLFREACLLVHGNYVKDLSVIHRDPSRMLLVDNSPHAYAYNTDNGIPIESWYDDETDTELLKLIGFLRKVENSQDVRPVVREHFGTHRLVEQARSGKVPHQFLHSAPPF